MRAGCIAQDMIVLRLLQNPTRWCIHGAAQNRRGTVLLVSHILGAPSFSAYRILGCSFRQRAVSTKKKMPPPDT
jgi:hypothetical protein